MKKKITAEQAKEAILVVKEFCLQIDVEDCRDYRCPLRDWCDLISNCEPAAWEVERWQIGGEE